jgi:site-specific recombinase XerD
MYHLPEALQSYFESALYGLESLLPWERVQNKPLLSSVYSALMAETAYTVVDIEHLKTLKSLADRITIPLFEDSKSLIEAEDYLLKACPDIPGHQIRYCLEYLYFLLCRHGLIEDDLSQTRLWLKIWRLVQRFEPLTQGLVSDYIRWLGEQSFSPSSTYDCVSELLKLQVWIKTQAINRIEDISDQTLAQYMEERGKKLKPTSRKRVLGSLKAVFYYYKAMVNGGYSIPEINVYAPTSLGLNQSANSLEISKLWEALEQNILPSEGALMIVLVLGFGLTVKALPLLRMTDQADVLVYDDQLPCRLGVSERLIKVPDEPPWLNRLFYKHLQKLKVGTTYIYLFETRYALKRNRPVSVEYCQRRVQQCIKAVLGYPLTVNYIERGAIKALARQLTLTDFMAQTARIPLSRKTRMMYWLQQNHVRRQT